MTTQLLSLPETKQKYGYYVPTFPAPIPSSLPSKEQIPTGSHGLAVSEETYWNVYYEGNGEAYYDGNYEWNNGILEEKGMSRYQVTEMSDWLVMALREYLNTHQIAKIVCSGTFGFGLQLKGGTVIRKPDVAVVLNSNLRELKRDDHSYKGIFDLCIEALSDSDKREIKRDTIQKKQEYAEARIKEYYLIDDKKRMAFYRLNKWGEYEEIEGEIIQSSVLPGFQFRKSDLFRRPTLEEMAEDEVYQGYVLPLYQEQKQELGEVKDELVIQCEQTEQERHDKEVALQRAEQERQAKEQERHDKEVALQRAEQERQAKEQERHDKEVALQRAEQERHDKEIALQWAEQERHDKEVALQRAELLAARLRELGIAPD